jgi:hypothetical protein
MHVHFLYDERLTDAMAAQFLRYGITSVRDTGGNLARLAALRERLEAGPEPAPRMFFAGPLLDGQFVVYDGGDPGRPPLGTDVSTPEAAERQVAELEAAGADFIKIYELVSSETFSALVEAARARGLPIAAHVPLSMVADQAGPQLAGIDGLDLMLFPVDEALFVQVVDTIGIITRRENVGFAFRIANCGLCQQGRLVGHCQAGYSGGGKAGALLPRHQCLLRANGWRKEILRNGRWHGGL